MDPEKYREKLQEKSDELKKKWAELYLPYRSENQIEKRLCEGIKDLKGLCWKFVSPGRTGVPDRIVILPTGQVFFVELKSPNGYPSPIQRMIHEMLKDCRNQVYVLSSYAEVDKFLERMKWFVDNVKKY